MDIDLGVIKFGLDTIVMLVGWIVSLAFLSYRAGKKTASDREALKTEISGNVDGLKVVVQQGLEKLRVENSDKLDRSVAGIDRRLSVVEDKQNNRAEQFAALSSKLESMPDNSDFNKLIQSEAKNAAKLDQLNNTVSLISESLMREREGQDKFINEQAARKIPS